MWVLELAKMWVMIRVQTRAYLCPCCGLRTLPHPPGSFDICPVCYWEADLVQSQDLDYEGGPNHVSLRQAQQNFAAFGAVEERLVRYVRLPTERERIDQT